MHPGFVDFFRRGAQDWRVFVPVTQGDDGDVPLTDCRVFVANDAMILVDHRFSEGFAAVITEPGDFSQAFIDRRDADETLYLRPEGDEPLQVQQVEILRLDPSGDALAILFRGPSTRCWVVDIEGLLVECDELEARLSVNSIAKSLTAGVLSHTVGLAEE